MIPRKLNDLTLLIGMPSSSNLFEKSVILLSIFIEHSPFPSKKMPERLMTGAYQDAFNL